MRAIAVPRKTERARELLKARIFPGTRSQRLFLITVDGRQSLAQLAPIAAGLGLDQGDVQGLVDEGLIEWVQPARRSVAADVPPYRQPAPLPAAMTTAAREPGHSARTLAAAKMYAIDLATLMLMGQDRQMRIESRDVVDEFQMRRWLADTATRISQVAGEARGSAFLERVSAVMPAGVAEVEKTDLQEAL